MSTRREDNRTTGYIILPAMFEVVLATTAGPSRRGRELGIVRQTGIDVMTRTGANRKGDCPENDDSRRTVLGISFQQTALKRSIHVAFEHEINLLSHDTPFVPWTRIVETQETIR